MKRGSQISSQAGSTRRSIASLIQINSHRSYEKLKENRRSTKKSVAASVDISPCRTGIVTSNARTSTAKLFNKQTR